MEPGHPTVAVSAPGKVLLAGGYLVLDRKHSGLVFGLSARINVIAGEIHTGPGVQLNEIVVDSPQFLDAQWRYGYHMAPEGGGIKVTQLQVGSAIHKNPFVETTLSYALTYISRLQYQHSCRSLSSARLIILADNDYYSQSTPSSGRPGSGRFAKFTVPLSGANKTGLGSSAALVTSLTASLLSHYLPVTLFDVASPSGQRTLHNLAQAAHCAAQGKVGSGFDVAAAVFGSCLYKRFSPELLTQIPETGAPGFSERLASVVDGLQWDVQVQMEGLRVPSGLALRMCDVDCGSQTVGMVKKVLAWKSQDVDLSGKLWDELQQRNEELAAKLRDGAVNELPAAIQAVRKLVREMGRLSDVPIEPESQTKLLDAVSEVDGVYGGVVPGAGGFDALALVMRDDEDTKKRLEESIAQWSLEKDSKVRLLDVKGEMEGVRCESLDVYDGWL
ncbi:phosphomevalonate kinase [Conoideocrella luteorostrata]|uniref:Phosphomevalonate kinase n=1 Tax=Conoideocrella luteorostrata TaxID=1105319 RepID=A0AAJ0CF95_9HYPO|nr:phosphomevalonate kinase [Conoideocrella luteorostrata]